MTAPLRPGSSLSGIPSCRTCTATVGECFTAWLSHGIFCCPNCEHRRWDLRPSRDRRPRPTVRTAPDGWSEEGWVRHVEASKRVLHLLSGLGVGRELGSAESRHEVQDRIRAYTAQLLDDTGAADTREIPRVPEQRATTSREASA